MSKQIDHSRLGRLSPEGWDQLSQSGQERPLVGGDVGLGWDCRSQVGPVGGEDIRGPRAGRGSVTEKRTEGQGSSGRASCARWGGGARTRGGEMGRSPIHPQSPQDPPNSLLRALSSSAAVSSQISCSGLSSFLGSRGSFWGTLHFPWAPDLPHGQSLPSSGPGATHLRHTSYFHASAPGCPTPPGPLSAVPPPCTPFLPLLPLVNFSEAWSRVTPSGKPSLTRKRASPLPPCPPKVITSHRSCLSRAQAVTTRG